MRKCPSYRFYLGLFTLTLIIILRFYLNSLMPDLVVLSGSAQLLPSWLETFLRIEDSTLTQASCYYRPSHFLSHPILVQHSIASPAESESSCSCAVPECKWRASFRPPALQSNPLYSVIKNYATSTRPDLIWWNVRVNAVHLLRETSIPRRLAHEHLRGRT